MKKSIFLLSSIIVSINAYAGDKRMVDCRLITAKTTECKPYPSKFMFTEKLTYGKDSHKLIISKTLPPVVKPKILKVINVEDMIEKHLVVLDSVRFSGSKPSPLRKTAQEIKEEETKKKEILLILAAYKLEKENWKLRKKKRIKSLPKESMPEKKESTPEKKESKYSKYSVKNGDSLIVIARLFGISTKELLLVNDKLTQNSTLKIGQKVCIPNTKKKTKTVAKKENLKKKKLASKLKKKYLNLKKKTRKKASNEYNKKLYKTHRGKRRLRVQATAYTSHGNQTDSTPFLAAWNNRIRPGMKIIAVSRDLISKYGLGNGKKVRIQGLPGYYTVRDKMNKRYTKRIDIYMGMNRRKALRWGRKRTVIYW